MNYNTLFYIIIVIIVADFALERILEYLNRKSMSRELPEELKDVYDEEQYRRQQEYKKVNDRFGSLTSSVSFTVVLIMLFLSGFSLVDSWAHNITGNPILVVVVFFGILAIASDILTTPFTIYDIFVIEEKFGFNRMTPGIFIKDKIKSWILGAVIGGGLLALIVWFYEFSGTLFWIYAWALAVAFTLFMAMFYSTLIVPLFNKQTPLPDGELRDAIRTFSEKAHFQLVNIYVIDGSKRSAKSNAYFAGLGPKKRIVLYDTLINELTTREIVAVLAHEIGHYKKGHIYIGLLAGIVQTGITLFLLSLMITHPALSAALGGNQPTFHLGLIAFGILYSPISAITGLLMNYISRKNEYAADGFVKGKGDAEALISALKKLSSKNLSNLTPHPAYVYFHYSHPTLLQRIQALRKAG